MLQTRNFPKAAQPAVGALGFETGELGSRLSDLHHDPLLLAQIKRVAHKRISPLAESERSLNGHDRHPRDDLLLSPSEDQAASSLKLDITVKRCEKATICP